MAQAAPRSWARTVDSGIRLALTVPLLASLAADLTRAWFLLSGVGPLVMVGILATLASIVGMLLMLWTRTETPGRLAGVAALFVFGQAWGLAEGALHRHPPLTWWPGGVAVVLICYIVVFSPPGRRLLIAVPTVLLLGLFRLALMSIQGEPLAESLAEGVLMVEVAAAAAILSDVLRRSAEGTDRALAERRGSRSQRAAAGVYRDQLREVERFLHDEVVHALRAIAMDRSRIPAEDATRAAAEAWEQLRPTREPPGRVTHDLMTGLESAAERSPCDVLVLGSAPPLPPDVVEAITLAAGEALRNVHLHSGVDAARVGVVRQGRGVVVTVEDDGRGFDPGTTPRRGSQTSIVERVEAVGGEARIHSDERGTRVELTWEPRRPDVYPGPDVRARLSLAGVPALLGTILVAVLLGPTIERPWMGATATVLVTLAGGWAMWRVQSRALRSGEQILLVAVSVAAILMNISALDPGDTRGLHLWLINGVSPLVLVVIVSSPLRRSVVYLSLLAATGIVATVLHFGIVASVAHFTLMISIPSAWFGVLGMQLVIERLSLRAMEAWESAVRSDSHIYHLAARAEISERRLARIREEIGPFLKAVGDGTADPNDSCVRRDAAVLEALVRDDIRFGGGSPAFRRQLTLMRRGGWDIEVKMSSVAVRIAGDVLLELTQALPASAKDGGLVLTSTPEQVVAVLSGLDETDVAPAAQRWRDRGGCADVADEYARLTMSLRVEAPVTATPVAPEV